ncbi:Ohr family peroxiredoxin [Pseudomonas fluorescens]|uniref:OsmC-like protein n=1 Tax=Pseudomonas fluorescens (strain Pf0-1) TaxID=205922 RepID=Q3K451_PSEPF|nr:Ohr family peroxiredoxin [Pseudomonas fluorescens]ABA77453.1 OsmC-like protein [Pseudomonas fluorescens Pf0-1]MBY9022643.1 Ohr family peroxiredoxin [Pseudomonas fluorescens]MBY9028635.1 Ohr family peroxiredoxin [Pseudomonas fluorescens]MBY9033805.1 Ohr family peroxiredoxin [Pseudomonas fluorescens]MBY9040286.1 Ohr family peroxiredoxin [Pseudomonas fluorescens]
MPSIEKILYSSRTFTIGGREGAGHSEDHRLDVQLTPPGAPGSGTNPEQLFAVCWSASLLAALRHACNARKIAFPAIAAIEAQIDLLHGEKGFFLQALIRVSLPEIDPEMAHRLIEAAYRNCPYSKATRRNIEVDLVLS